MSRIYNLPTRLINWWVKLCTGRETQNSLDEEHYRQQILVITSLFWLLTVLALTAITPLILKMTPEGRLAASALFVATGISVLASMLVLRLLDNRLMALHMLLLVYTGAFAAGCLYFGGTRSPTYALLILAPVMAGIVGSVAATVFWGLVVLSIWITLLALERFGVQFQQIILPQNYNVAITIAYTGMGVAVCSIIMIYAEMNKNLRHSLQRTNRELDYLSFHDDLTGLHNRRAYNDRMERSMDRAAALSQPLGLIIFDLDDFKTINDSWGHGVGDSVLAALGERLRAELRETDFAARLGGDEFAVILENVGSPDELTAMAEKVAAIVRQPAIIRRHVLTVETSCGFAMFPEHGSTRKALEEKADRAMYLAKDARTEIAQARRG
jgi:diguanylate cyclase (GGDEF)-like protein